MQHLQQLLTYKCPTECDQSSTKVYYVSNICYQVLTQCFYLLLIIAEYIMYNKYNIHNLLDIFTYNMLYNMYITYA